MNLRRLCSTLGLTLGFLLITTPGHAQGVYKWVDAEGKTHYGSQPPTAEQKGEELKLHSNTGFGGNNNIPAKGKSEYNADGTKKVSKDVQELADGMAKSLKKVDPNNTPLNCATAVENIHYQANLMLEVAQKNVKDGYLSQADFDTTAPKVKQAKSETSVSDCSAATGAKRSFYQCMTSDRNHVTGCASKFKY